MPRRTCFPARPALGGRRRDRDAQLPGEEGHYLLCAVSGEGYDLAASVIFEVDRTPPTLAADAEVERLEGGGVAVRPLLRPPELAAVRFTWGAPGAVDCEDPDALAGFLHRSAHHRGGRPAGGLLHLRAGCRGQPHAGHAHRHPARPMSRR